MKSVRVEFVRPPSPSRSSWTAAAAMSAVAVGLMILGLRDSGEARSLRLRAEAQLAQAQAEAVRAAAQRPATAPTPPPAYAADALAALRQQEFPLDSVLTALETVGVVGIRLVAVDVVTSDASVRVQVEFSDYEALLKYLSELNAGEPMERWALVSAQSNAGAATGRPTANLTSTWRAQRFGGSR